MNYTMNQINGCMRATASELSGVKDVDLLKEAYKRLLGNNTGSAMLYRFAIITRIRQLGAGHGK
jgi:hypothetical protein